MSFLEHRTFIGQRVKDIIIKLGQVLPTIIQNVRAKEAFARSHFHDLEGGGVFKDFPHLMELPGDEVAEDRVNIGAGVKIALGPDLFPGRMVITQLRVVKHPGCCEPWRSGA